MKSKKTFSESTNREQYEYARGRLKKKKNLMRHFIFFLAGSILFLIMDLALGFGKDTLPMNWSAYLILFWFFILLVHTLNVFLLNSFMGRSSTRKAEKQANATYSCSTKRGGKGISYFRQKFRNKLSALTA